MKPSTYPTGDRYVIKRNGRKYELLARRPGADVFVASFDTEQEALDWLNRGIGRVVAR
jgi:hypothetical protein